MPFKKGKSGNPEGRPPGARQMAHKYLEFLRLDTVGMPILKKMVEQAQEGDRQIQMFLADRFVGRIPADALLPKIKLSGTLKEKLKQLEKMLEDGNLSSKEYKDLTSALESEASIIKVIDYDVRLEKLESSIS